MLKQVKEYCNGYTNMACYTNGELIKGVAFVFLVGCYCVGWLILNALLFATAPVWIIPYCIYKGRKERQWGNLKKD